MEIKPLYNATRGQNVAALFRLDVPGSGDLGPTFICYFRVSFADGARVEEWTRCTPCQEDAYELYRRGLEDFIEPVPFSPIPTARVEPEQPAQNPSLHQVVFPDGSRSVPMALNAAEREAERFNNGGAQ